MLLKHLAGWGYRRIARNKGISHETVRTILERQIKNGGAPPKRIATTPTGTLPAGAPTAAITEYVATLKTKEASAELRRIDRKSREAIIRGLDMLFMVARRVERTQDTETQIWLGKTLVDAGNALQAGRRREEEHAVQVLVDARRFETAPPGPSEAAAAAAAMDVADKILDIVCKPCMAKIANMAPPPAAKVVHAEVVSR